MGGRLQAGTERRSMRMVWKTLRPRHVGLAFFWACSMLTFRSSILLFGPANTPDYETLVLIASFVANMTVLFAVSAFMERDPRTFDRLPGWLFAACSIAGIVVLNLAGKVAGGAPMTMILIGGSVLVGVGYGYYWGSWAEYLGRMHPSRTSFYIPTAFLLTAALFLLVSTAVEKAGVPPLLLMAPLPLLSLFCLRRCHAEFPEGHYARNTDSRRYLTALTSLVALIVSSLVLSLLFGLVWEMTVLSVGSVNEAHQTPLEANLVVALLLIALVLYAHKRLDLALVYRFIVPVIVILFAVLPFFWETGPIVLNTVMSASYGVFDVIIWYMTTSTAYDFAVSGFVTGGIVRALSILARLVGIGIGYLLVLIPGGSSVLIVAMSLGALYVLAMLGLFYLTRRKGTSLENAPEKALAAVHELTAREARAAEIARAAEVAGGRGTAGAGGLAAAKSSSDKIGAAPIAAGSGATPNTSRVASPGGAGGPEAEGRSGAPRAGRGAADASASGAAGVDEAPRQGTGDAAETGGGPGASASAAEADARNIDGGQALDGEHTPLPEEVAFEMIAEDFSLTRREAELLPFIWRGRSARVMGDALFVSENTIRTHTRRILEKTDLHSKQQVIDLIERYR